ncbi:RES family NAD+ phosphorylase [Planctomonas sp. JC2975]|uniref:RES family NAD+ phosphorylase n=1 Tax=Planctomonas sp. JC2975 TaxID=2729626 RepID=UPI001472A807|nr:RES family NAD+ phosphorylase [Planctomonas sp. JC2975]NNC14085.1 RES family NAD+ phosphorylase [Planctomonas sp. JC2975]
MTPYPEAPVLVDPPAELFRVERRDPPLRYSRIRAEDAANDRGGNRFDVPGGGVLYAATTAQGALAETTASFRPSASILARMAAAGADPAELTGPSLDASWRASRVIRTLHVRESLPFVDIEAPVTHTYLTRHASNVLLGQGVQNLDVATVLGPSRLLTRGLATWLYQARDSSGYPMYGGIRYLSRLNTAFECWAIFEGATSEVTDERRITIDDPDLRAIASEFSISLV